MTTLRSFRGCSRLVSLTGSQFDWSKGRLVHRRVKTRRNEWTPLVNYKLWDVTLEALRAIKADKTAPDDLVFTLRGGATLTVCKRITKDGEEHITRYDNVSRSWCKMAAKGTVPNKSFKFVRKVGVSALQHHSRLSRLEDLFLGHAGKTMAKRHYALLDEGRPFKPLDMAVKYIGLRLGLVQKQA